MSLTKETKRQIIDKYRLHDHDSGSPEVQIALLTERINSINAHMGRNKKDYHTQRGLLKLVGRRRKLLKYIKRVNESGYRSLIASLGLRK